MKPKEVGIIVIIIAALGYYWYTHKSPNQTASPVNSVSPGYMTGTP